VTRNRVHRHYVHNPAGAGLAGLVRQVADLVAVDVDLLLLLDELTAEGGRGEGREDGGVCGWWTVV
jgi:hypothetical protein